MARVHSLMASLAGDGRSGLSPSAAGPAADRAVELLREAVAGGYRNFAGLNQDAELTPLRGRPISG